MRTFLFYILLTTISTALSAQNLIPNGSFEDYKSCLHNREASVADAAPWYIAGGTPDMYQFNCGPSLVNSTYNIPYEGDAHIGLGNGPSLGGAFFSESIAVPLKETLVAGKAYFFEASVRSFKFNTSTDGNINQCTTNPRRQFNVYLSRDSFEVVWTFENDELIDSYANGHIVFADSSSLIIDGYSINTPGNYIEEEITGWYRIKTCIIAKGGEQHLGLAPTIGKYVIEDRCLQFGTLVFAGHYFHVDAISLKQYPENLEVTQTICEGHDTKIHLRTLVPMPMFDKASFRWADGNTDSIRQVTQVGTHLIEVISECETTLLDLTLESEFCAATVYVPTAFSPNNDGINDQFKLFISSSSELRSYHFQVYDRWGELCFESYEPTTVWDGYIKNKTASTGIYIWQLQYELKENATIQTYTEKGDFLLVR